MSDDDDRVGYGRPPRKNRFQKGMIANPNGRAGRNRTGKRPRPDDLKSQIAELWKKLASEKRKVTIDGKPQALSTTEIVIRRLFNDAMAGKSAAVREMRIWQERFPELVEAAQVVPSGQVILMFQKADPEVVRGITQAQIRKAFPEMPEVHFAIFCQYFLVEAPPKPWEKR